MFRSICKLALMLPPLLSGTLAVLHAHPYDASDLHTIFNADAVSFMDIQPGVTNLRAAHVTLQAHPWIGRVLYRSGMALDSGLLSWTWSGAQPAFINDGIEGKVWIQDGRVEELIIATRFSFGDLWLTQPPLNGRVFSASVSPPRVHHRADYGLTEAHTDVACPLRPQSFWKAPVTFLERGADYDERYPHYRLPAWGDCT
jgi:hypothetical protein